MAIQLEDPKLFWCMVQKRTSSLAMRQVWDGAHIVANYKPISLETTVRPYSPARKQ